MSNKYLIDTSVHKLKGHEKALRNVEYKLTGITKYDHHTMERLQ